MKNKWLRKNLLASLLSLVMILSLIPTNFGMETAAAATSSTSSLYYNTGHRDTVATELSDAAKAYYSNYAYTPDKLGTVSDERAAELRTSLASLMQSTLENQVPYKSLPTYWAYSDAEDGKAGVTFFYTDDNSTNTDDLNREHVWPKSAASFQELNGGADLHHLRPAHATVNSARSNFVMADFDETASGVKTVTYDGKVAGYLYNNQFEPLDNVKGDVARIFLYVYLCWGQPNLYDNVATAALPAFDSDDSKNDGTERIDELETLLQWCYDDPVDTWEMSQNDIIELVQGNRNVFVDYPEYAWLIFGLEAPEGIASPMSGNGTKGTYDPGNLDAVEAYYAKGTKVVINEEDVISLAEANNAADGTMVTVKGQVAYRFGLKDSLTSAVIIDENGDALQLYFNNTAFKYAVGDIILAKGSIASYHGVKQLATGFASELVSAAADNAAVTVQTVTVAELIANIDNYVSKPVYVENLVLGGKSTDGIIATQTIDGVTSQIELYSPASYPSDVERTDTVNVYACASKRDTTSQLRIGASADYTLVSKGEGYTYDLNTVDGKLEYIFDLESNETTTDALTLTGTISSIKTAYASNYNNISVNIDVTGESGDTKTVLCFRLAGGSELAVGNTITVTGKVTNYNGTVEFVQGSTYVLEGGATPTAVPTAEPTTAPTAEPTTVPETDLTTEEGILAAAFNLAVGESLSEKVTLTGEITKINTAYSESYKNISVTIKVADKSILCYRLAGGSDLAVGDVIAVTGIIKNYNGTVEFDAKCTYDKKTVVTPTTTPTAEPTTAPTATPTTAPTAVPTAEPTTAPESERKFAKVNSIDELEVGASYIFYGVNATNTGAPTEYAMGNKLSNSRPLGVDVTVTDDTIVTNNKNIIWTVEEAKGVYYLKNEGNGKYLILKKDSTSPFVFEATASSGYTVTETDGNFSFTGTVVSRIISIYEKDFRAYKAGVKEIQTLNLYKEFFDPEFEKITSAAEIGEEGQFVIYGHALSGDNEGAMTNVIKSEQAGMASVTFTENGTIAEDVVEASTVWTFKKNEDGYYTIYSEEADKYLELYKKSKSTTQCFRLSDTPVSVFDITANESGFAIVETNITRGILLYSNSFRAYATSNNDPRVDLYRLGGAAETTPEPTATSTPVPTATSTPVPTATSTPVPTATSTPVPTATNTPTPTATTVPVVIPTQAPKTEGTFKQITSLEELADGGQIIFYGISGNGGGNYAMGNELNSSKPKGVSVDLEAVDGVSTIVNPDPSVIWSVMQKEDGTYLLYNAESGKFLDFDKNSTSPFTLTTTPQYAYTVAVDNTNSGDFHFGTTMKGNSRIVSIYKEDFRAYGLGSKDDKSTLYLYKFYEKTEPTPVVLPVETTISSAWGNMQQTEITIKADEAGLENWKVIVPMPEGCKITAVYNAKLVEEIEGGYVIGAPDWNKNIAASESYSFSIVIEKSEDIEVVEIASVTVVPAVVEAVSDFTYEYTQSGWAGGFVGNVNITATGEAIENWQMEFDFADEIAYLWNAVIVSHEGTHYVIKNAEWNATINSGATVNFGFVGVPAEGEYSEATFENVVLTSIQ